MQKKNQEIRYKNHTLVDTNMQNNITKIANHVKSM